LKHLFTLGIFIITLFHHGYGQSEIENIASEICGKIEKLDLNKSTQVVNQKAQEIIQSTYLRNQEKIRKLITDYSEEYKNKSDIELSKIIGRDITFHLMKTCETYQRITMFKNEPVPKISKTAEKVCADFTAFLVEKTKSEDISQSIVDECMILALDKNEKLLIKKYESKYSWEFTQEFQAYLLTRCEPYMKWTASMIN
jgi:hypothetical protein